MIEIIPNWNPIFIHFPIALIVVSTLTFMLGQVVRTTQTEHDLLVVSRWTLWAAALLAIFTTYTGMQAYESIPQDAPAYQAMLIYQNWGAFALATLFIFAIVSFIYRKKWGIERVPLTLATFTLLIVLIGTTAWFGGEVAYRHSESVMSIPKSETFEDPTV